MLKRFRVFERSPLTIIELIIAVATIIGGLYVFTPFLVVGIDVSHGPQIAKLIASTLGIAAVGGVAVLAGALSIFGIYKRSYKLRSAGLFTNIILRTYTLSATILIQGFLPLTWLSGLTILLVLIVCWIVVRGFINVEERIK